MSGDIVPLLFGLSCGGIFILALGTLGIFLIVYAIRSRKKADASQGWPSATGQVDVAKVKSSTNTDEDGRTDYSYYPSVEYVYQVGSQTYTGRRIAFGGIRAYGSESKAAADLSRFPVGSQVAVYYNPEKPGDAVLERKAGGSVWGLAVGIICLALTVCIACPLLTGLAINLLSKT